MFLGLLSFLTVTLIKVSPSILFYIHLTLIAQSLFFFIIFVFLIDSLILKITWLIYFLSPHIIAKWWIVLIGFVAFFLFMSMYNVMFFILFLGLSAKYFVLAHILMLHLIFSSKLFLFLCNNMLEKRMSRWKKYSDIIFCLYTTDMACIMFLSFTQSI